jgi:hypothetical protein
VNESVRDSDERRLWRCKVKVRFGWFNTQSTSFKRYSSRLTMAQLEPLLIETGFGDFERLALRGDRTSGHAALLARKLRPAEA